MKKLLFALLGSFALQTNFSQAPTTLLYTDFSSGIPAGWTQQIEPGANGWLPGTSAQLSSPFFIIPNPPFGTQIIASNDDACNCETYDWIITPTINALGYDSLEVFFSAYYTGAFGSLAYAAYSRNNGATWQGFNVPANANWSNWVYTLPADSLTATMRFAFIHDDDFLWSSGFALNEIEISGFSVPTCNLTQPAGAILETETCGQNTNGGCTNLSATPPLPPAYQSLTCGQTVFGSLWANNGTRDLDWYQFTVTTPGITTFTAQAELPFVLLFVSIANCASAQVLASTMGESCGGTQTLSFDFQTAGTYAAVIAPAVFDGFPCNTFNDYIATLQLPSVTPIITASGPTNICSNQSLSLTASGTGTFQWQNNGNNVGTNSSTFVPTISGDYGVVVTNANNCSTSSETVNVTITPVDNADFSFPSNTLCLGSGLVNPTFSATGTFSSTPAGLIINPTTGQIDLDNSLEAVYTVTFATNGTCPSSSTQTLFITDEPNASFSYSSNVFCANEANPIPQFLPESSAGVFSSTAGLAINPNSGLINLAQSTPGTYTVTNTIAASGSCPQAVETFEVTINAQPTATISANALFLCEGSNDVITVSITLTGEAPFNFTFFNGDAEETINNYLQNTYTTTTNQPGQYFIVSLADENCTGIFSQDVLNISVGQLPTVTLGSLQNACKSSTSYTLSGGSPAGGVYSGNFVTGGIFNPSLAGVGTFTITYTYTNAEGCSDFATSTISVVEGPTVSLASFANVCNNVQPFNLTGGSPAGGSYSGPGVSNGIFTPSLLGAGTYEITYTFTDANGCTGSATQAIKVDDCTSGLADLNNGLQFEMFPNPTSDKVNLMINNDETTDINIRIISLDGKIIESVFIRNTLNFNHTLDVYNYTSGVYFVHISSNLGNVVKKLIVN